MSLEPAVCARRAAWAVTLRSRGQPSPIRFEIVGLMLRFSVGLCDAICSSYYHLAPDNARLVWDRLPMTVGFMGLLAAMMLERSRLRARSGVARPAGHCGRGIGPLLVLDRGKGRRAICGPIFSCSSVHCCWSRLFSYCIRRRGSGTRYIVGGWPSTCWPKSLSWPTPGSSRWAALSAVTR